MSLRHAVLGMLAVKPSTGYELAQRFELSLGNAWHASHSQLYPELAKLQERGWVELVGEGPRRSRIYGVTDDGHEELRRWLVEVPPVRTQRNESAVRMFLTPLLDPDERRRVLERDLADVEQQRVALEQRDAELSALDAPHPFHPSVELGLRFNDVLQAWLREQIDAL